MPSHIKTLNDQKKVTLDEDIYDGLEYETIVGSQSYGVASNISDVDIYAFYTPPIEVAFPYHHGYMVGLDDKNIFKPASIQHHGIELKSTPHDLQIYTIARYMELCAECNPNMIDSLFTRENLVTFSSDVGKLVRDNRHIFLSKRAFKTFKGYAFSQLRKLSIKTPKEGSKRKFMVEAHGYDVKFAYHIIRLLLEVEQILKEGTLDLMQNKDQLKSIRGGEWTADEVIRWAISKEKDLEGVNTASLLPEKPDMRKIRQLLLDSYEISYGRHINVSLVEKREEEVQNDVRHMVDDLRSLINRYK